MKAKEKQDALDKLKAVKDDKNKILKAEKDEKAKIANEV